MTSTLIVLAHPEQRSFNATWAAATRRACERTGHTVLWSDLVAMGFDPVESARHYVEHQTDTPFDALKAQEQGAQDQKLPLDVASEIAKLQQADRVIFHFPIWWFAPPAVLKGWFDRVLAHGALHNVGRRFDNGDFRWRKALFCVTTGSTEAESSFKGKEGDIQMLLWPAAYTLRYLGFSVLVPQIVHGVHGYHRDERKAAMNMRLQSALDGQDALVAGFDNLPLMEFNADSDFDQNGQLKPDSPSHTAFIRHDP
ncbi:NAD(P)H-dependent oxidoreductase [Flavimaricola marinus]|uniref:General stress protein 14 n=1 Tax=Flavimaricola marinus TaxID=1819565 RepID=A0A238LC67_9RHOB|nr:NAD(P)H-dependent oxidoreductase [Flavimaricola marinus]SMY07317.1 General stress protein 14 [Flavimaricola marinus]